MEKNCDKIFTEVQKQIADNKRKDDEYFAHVEKTLKENEKILKEAKNVCKRHEAMWGLLGIKVGQDDGKNPFFFLEQVAPEAFKGLSMWAERSRKKAHEELEKYGISYAELEEFRRSKKIKKQSIVPGEPISSGSPRKVSSGSRKSIRRVRI